MEEEIRYVQSLLRDISFYDDGVERVIPDGVLAIGANDGILRNIGSDIAQLILRCILLLIFGHLGCLPVGAVTSNSTAKQHENS